MNIPTNFVVYFSTAQEELGYVTLGDNGSTQPLSIGGPPIPSGTYFVENGKIVAYERTNHDTRRMETTF